MLATPLSLLTRLVRRRGAVRAQEPADMGTAFGMECWLDEAQRGSAAAPPVRALPPPMRRMQPVRWLPRWLNGTRRA